MRTVLRRVGKSAAAVAIGYGGYTAAVQYRASLEIARREREVPDNMESRYAPIKIMGRYVNPFVEYRHQTSFEFGFRRISESFALHPAGDVPVDRALSAKASPIYTPDFAAASNNGRSAWIPAWFGRKGWFGHFGHDRMASTWFGQSCALAQSPGDVRVLTDPMFADFVVSPHVGPQRLVPAPVVPEAVPQPQVISVSHDHQDHLDSHAADVSTKPGTTWVVPEGVAKHLPSRARSIELTWWDRIPMPNVDPKLGYEIVCTPAMHWSGRALYDSNTSLWCSFLVSRHGKPSFFHGGDTGYSPASFTAIARVYGQHCPVAMIPCGAYLPRWHLRAQHMAPDESLQTMLDLGAQNLVGVHWGTFVMSEEPFSEPPKRLSASAKEAGLTNVYAPALGKTMLFDI